MHHSWSRLYSLQKGCNLLQSTCLNLVPALGGIACLSSPATHSQRHPTSLHRSTSNTCTHPYEGTADLHLNAARNLTTQPAPHHMLPVPLHDMAKNGTRTLISPDWPRIGHTCTQPHITSTLRSMRSCMNPMTAGQSCIYQMLDEHVDL